MKSKWLYVISLGFVLLTGLAACAQPASGDVLRSDKPRESPAVSQSDLAALVGGNNAFSFDLYQALKGSQGNLFYSPYSISLALAMTYAGARDSTEKQMAGTLHYTLPQDRLHQAFNGLDQELSGRGQGAKGKDGQGFRLNIVNAIWGQKGYPFLAQYLDLLAEDYGTGLRTLDFRGAPDASRQTINKWVEDQTEHLGYAVGDGYQAVTLPYDGRELEMVVLLPDQGKFAEFEKSLNAGKVTSIINGITPEQVALSLPSYKYESQFSLSKILAAMGMPIAFSGQADFSGMTGNRELSISEVIHKAFVAVDESGTEAAAATAVIMRATAMPVMPLAVTVDRPFIFLIRDIKSGSVIFVGRVMNPSG